MWAVEANGVPMTTRPELKSLGESNRFPAFVVRRAIQDSYGDFIEYSPCTLTTLAPRFNAYAKGGLPVAIMSSSLL